MAWGILYQAINTKTRVAKLLMFVSNFSRHVDTPVVSDEANSRNKRKASGEKCKEKLSDQEGRYLNFFLLMMLFMK